MRNHCIAIIVICFLLCNGFGHGTEAKSRKKREGFSISSIFSTVFSVLRTLHNVQYKMLRNDWTVSDAIFRNVQNEIITKMNEINRKLSNLEHDLKCESYFNTMMLLPALTKTVRTELGFDEMAKILDQIDTAYDTFRGFLRTGILNETVEEIMLKKQNDNDGGMKNEIGFQNFNLERDNGITDVETFTLQNFATWAAGYGSDSLPSLTSRLHKIMVPNSKMRRAGLFDALNSQSKEFKTAICQMKESPHQGIYNLYNIVTLADFKGQLMLQFSFMILKLYDKGNFTTEINQERAKLEKRLEEKATAARNALANADRSAYNCDPVQHVEGVTYVKLTKLLRGYIENEINLNPYGTCRENCAYYYYTTYSGCYKGEFCNRQQQCRGRVVECKYVDADMDVCKSSDPERRYDWVEYENGRVLGTKGRCLQRNFYKVDSWWRYVFWHCSYCFCLCDEGEYNSDRYINLRPVTSDIDQNKVVTGVKISKHNRIIHLRIQQSKLNPHGTIDKSTTSWKPLDNYTITDRNVKSGIDYHIMDWMARAIDLDDLVGPKNHVLTGIRFRTVGPHINLEIRVTPFNFTTGKLFTEVHSTWISNDNTEVSLEKPRKQIFLKNPDIPIRNGPHIIDSEHNQFIKFRASSFDSDVAQNTVPFFDAQPILSYGFPLSGLGLMHRGKSDSGGFIAPKLITYDFGPYI